MPETETTGTETPQAVMDAEGKFSENWYEKYGEENSAHLSRYKDFDSLVKAQIATKRKLGKDPDTLVEIPTESSSDEVKAAFRKAVGVGESLDDYDYVMPDELAEKLEPINDERLSAFKKFAFEELEISPAKFKKLLNYYHYDIANMIDKGDAIFEEKKAADIDKAEKELRKQPGWQSDKEYKDKILLANSVLRRFGGKEAVEAFNAENSPLMVRFLANVAGAFSESTLKDGGAPDSSTGNIKEQINKVRERMTAIQKENPFNFKANPEFKELKQRKTELYKKLSA